NEQAHFGALHNTIKSTEELYERILSRFLQMDSPGDLMINLVVVALLPAVGEELFFRGCAQNILERWTKSPVIAIVLSSFGFALLHGTFFKFLPILLLGIVLGTLFYITRNLWYSIFFHFLNNAVALLASYYAQRNDFMKQLAENEVKFSVWAGLISLLLTVGIFYFMRKREPYRPVDADLQPPHDDDLLRTSR
ncbi:MAG TPA: CPBP family intramembrane glutamic endopeptidase, partial [Chitinophagaceae bacterium]|nr:CPBP family intramembrane glutamic endopeptidase [Chitinophagaceae bacterium]